MLKILIAEDEMHLRCAIAKSLRNEGYHVLEGYDGKNALDIFYKEHIDLIITDIMMPRMDGNVFVKEIRAINKDIPILMLTALEDITDKEVGFNNGADDYLVKPVQLKEINIRVKALLRRAKINSEQKIVLKDTTLDNNSQSFKIKEKLIELTKKEFQLLFKLLSNPNVIFSREQLLNEIWGYSSSVNDRTVDTHISWLREKVLNDDFEILTVWGLGYKAVIKS